MNKARRQIKKDVSCSVIHSLSSAPIMNPLWIIAAIALLIVAVWGFYVWYQNRRSRESFKSIDYSKLNDLDNDGWDNK